MTNEQERAYKARYCGVCHSLKRLYGAPYCGVLSYECAFIALARGLGGQVAQGRCVVNPFRKVWLTADEEYLAHVNVFLARHKLEDDKRDENKLGARALGLVFDKKRHVKALGEAACQADGWLKELEALEKEGCGLLDAPANAFGRVLGGLMAYGIGGEKGRVLEGLGFNLGRWVYLMDAWDDLEKDAATGSYNVLIRGLGSAAGARNELERVEYNLLHSLGQAGACAELLPSGLEREAVLAIIDKGALGRTRALLRPQKDEDQGRSPGA